MADTKQEALAQQETPAQRRALDFQGMVDAVTTRVVAALPLSVRDEDLKRARARFRVAFSAEAHGDLQLCTPQSVARAIVLSALSGLFPGGPSPDVYLIPRKNKHRGGALEVNWQMAWRGYIRLARRAGWDIEPVLVFEGEPFRVHEGMAPRIEHERRLDVPMDWGHLVAGYARVYPLGHRDQAKIAYLSRDQVQQRRAKAQTQEVWNEWPLEMALKTICNYAGARELFPVDDPARYAMAADTATEIGAAPEGSLTGPTLPALASRTDEVVRRISGGAGQAVQENGATGVDVAAAPVAEDQPQAQPSAAGAPAEPQAEQLYALGAEEIEVAYKMAAEAGVSAEQLEAAVFFGEESGRKPLGEIVASTPDGLERWRTKIRDKVAILARDARRRR